MPAQFLFDGVERSVGCIDLSDDLPLEVAEADQVVAVMVRVEDRVLAFLPSH